MTMTEVGSFTVNVSLTAAGLKLIGAQFEALPAARTNGGTTSTAAQVVPSEVKRKRGRPAKAAAAEVEEDDTEDTTDDDFEVDEDETDETEDEETEDEPAPKKKAGASAKAAAVLTLDVMIKAFQDYAERHSRDKAAKILAKYKVKSVRLLPEDKYAEVLKVLKA